MKKSSSGNESNQVYGTKMSSLGDENVKFRRQNINERNNALNQSLSMMSISLVYTKYTF